MIRQSPDDPILHELKERVRDRLFKAVAAEQSQEPVDPLQASVDLMALSADEVEKWMAVFRKFDHSKTGALKLPDLIRDLDEYSNSYFEHIFTSQDALDPDTGLLEYPDFVRAVSTFCFFGRKEILRWGIDTFDFDWQVDLILFRDILIDHFFPSSIQLTLVQSLMRS